MSGYTKGILVYSCSITLSQAAWQHVSLAPRTKRIRFHLVPSHRVEDMLTRRGRVRHESARIRVIKRKMCSKIVVSKLSSHNLSCKSKINVSATLKITMDKSKQTF